jgi:hypothetical protein
MICGPLSNGPKNVRLFINRTTAISFDNALTDKATEEFEITPAHLQLREIVHLRRSKFQRVYNVQMFVKDNQGDEETTRMDNVCFIGLPVPIPITYTLQVKL